MPGTVVRDALEPDLLTGVTLTTVQGDDTGDVHDILWPREVQFALEGLDDAPESGSLTVYIEGADNEAFDENVVVIAAFGPGIDDSVDARQLTTYVDKRYIRAQTSVSGASADYTGATLTTVLPHDRRVRATTTA